MSVAIAIVIHTPNYMQFIDCDLPVDHRTTPKLFIDVGGVVNVGTRRPSAAVPPPSALHAARRRSADIISIQDHFLVNEK